MSVIVESFNKKFDHLRRPVKKAADKISRLLRQKNRRVEIYLVDKSVMDKNVLAFPAPKSFPRPDIKQKPLGEIYLNPDRIRKETLEFGFWNWEFPAMLYYMLTHGYLHLLGYDHKKKNDRIKMEKKERQILNQICNT